MVDNFNDFINMVEPVQDQFGLIVVNQERWINIISK